MAAQTQPTDELGNQYQGGPGGPYPPPVTDGPPPSTGDTVTDARFRPPAFAANYGPPSPFQGSSAYGALPELQGLGGPISANIFQAPEIRQRTVAPAQVDFSQFGPYTRQMTDEELTSRQLQGLLASDSPYMRQAALAGQRMAAQRGALSSSISAGASQASAIQAALPIAAADAQAYQRMASENAAAINSTNLAKLQSSTSLALGNLQSLTALAQTGMQTEAQAKVAALSANAQAYISQLQIQAQKENLIFEAAHQRSMEFLRQEGNLNLAGAEHGFRMQEIGLQGNINYQLLTTEIEASRFESLNAGLMDALTAIMGSGVDSAQIPGMITNLFAAYSTGADITFDMVYGPPSGG